MSEIDASLIIITYNQLPYLKTLMQSVNMQKTDYEFEIIIVNDCSNDGTNDYLKSLAINNNIIIINNNENIGRAKSRNVGAANANGRILIFIDGDMELAESIIEIHINCHENKERSIAVGSVDYGSLGSLEDYLQSRGPTKLDRKKDIPFRYFASGNFSIPSTVFSELKGFDIDYSFYGGEDIDFGYRASSSGISIDYLSSAKAKHIHKLSLQEVLNKRYKFGLKALPLFASKHNKAALDIPIYRMQNNRLLRAILYFIFNRVFYGIGLITGDTSSYVPNIIYDYLIYGAVFKGLNASRKKSSEE
ncbi:MAG: glycosyltransferase family 2 protein [candidate division Zixibacteria bacterium]|nr:glycosyltransferase family 2 protein [candidate division Zixibacteria bacterium]